LFVENLISADGFKYILDGVSFETRVDFGLEFIRIGNYYMEQVDNRDLQLETLDVLFEVDSSFLAGSYTVDSIQKLEKYDSDDSYSAGQFLFGCADNSSIRTTINGGQSTDLLTIEADSDGDGVYESVLNQTWEEIESGI
jgi:hypothetical protein